MEKSFNTIDIAAISCTVLLLSTNSTRWMLNHLHRVRSRFSWLAKFLDIACTLLTVVVASGDYRREQRLHRFHISRFKHTFSNEHHCFFDNWSVLKGLVFLIKNYVALNEASIAFWELFSGLVRRDNSSLKAAFNSQTFSARSALAWGQLAM